MDETVPTAADNGRDRRSGRFLPGNAGGPGSPKRTPEQKARVAVAIEAAKSAREALEAGAEEDVARARRFVDDPTLKPELRIQVLLALLTHQLGTPFASPVPAVKRPPAGLPVSIAPPQLEERKAG